jgi:hypothetical protein
MRNLLAFCAAFFLVIGTLEAASNTDVRDTTRDAHPKWQGPDGIALPFSKDEELLEFLRTAEITKSKVLTSGSNRPLKARLEKDGIQANAIFRTVELKQPWANIDGRHHRNFRDSCFYECAAYEMSRILGLDNVPPCVIRNVAGKEGTMQLWVENAETMKERLEEAALVSNQHWAGRRQRHWARQGQVMRVFDALIDNFDRNIGNMLLGAGEKLWFIDHTRSFTVSTRIDLDKIVWCERDMWKKMKALNMDLLKDRLRSTVEHIRILALLERRDKLVGHIQALIDERGEDVVLFDASPVVVSADGQR